MKRDSGQNSKNTKNFEKKIYDEKEEERKTSKHKVINSLIRHHQNAYSFPFSISFSTSFSSSPP